MSNFDVNQLLENSQKGEFDAKMKKAKKFIQKWEATGLLDGDDLKSQKYGKERMAEILENQAKQLVTEQSQTGTGASFSTGTGENWAGVALPLVRKIFADISSKEFVSVQPMSLPSGLVFYLEFKYGSNRPNFQGNTTRFNVGDSLYGFTSGKNTTATSGLYGPGRFNYSTQYSTASVNLLSGSAAVYSDVNFNAAYSSSIVTAGISKYTISNLSIVAPGIDLNGVRAFSVTSSGISELNLLPEFTVYNSGSDIITFVVSASAGSNQSGSLFYYLQPKDNARGDFEDTTTRPLTGSAAIPDINLEMRSEAIVAKTRKLKAQWTPEFSQDLNAYQSLDAEAEVTSILSEYISMEIDLEILDMLIENANTTDIWSANPGQVINSAGTAFQAQSLTYTSQGAWFQTLGTKIQKVSNIIHQKTLRGGANFLVLSPTISTVLESIPGYAADTNGEKMQYNMGVQKAGMINSRQKVYKNPYMTENIILMGYRGSQFLETGAVYAPYIPLIMTPLVYDPNTFTPRKGIMTRYAKKIVRPEFYGKIFIADLNAL